MKSLACHRRPRRSTSRGRCRRQSCRRRAMRASWPGPPVSGGLQTDRSLNATTLRAPARGARRRRSPAIAGLRGRLRRPVRSGLLPTPAARTSGMGPRCRPTTPVEFDQPISATSDRALPRREVGGAVVLLGSGVGLDDVARYVKPRTVSLAWRRPARLRTGSAQPPRRRATGQTARRSSRAPPETKVRRL